MSTQPAKKEPASFEQAMKRLEAIVGELDSPDTELEKTISLVEEGLSLIRSSRNMLKNAEERIRTLEESEEDKTPVPQDSQKPASLQEDGFSLL